MPYLSKEDLKSHLYQEVIDEIIREDESIPTEAIACAVDEAKSYLSRYDLDKLFGTETTEPEAASPALKRKVKDIAVWYLLLKANPGVSLELFETSYDNAVAWLKDIQRGMANPDWPYKDTTGQTAPQGSSIHFSANPKRNNSF